MKLVREISSFLIVTSIVLSSISAPVRSMLGSERGNVDIDSEFVNPYVTDGLVGLWDVDYQGNVGLILDNIIPNENEISLQFKDNVDGWLFVGAWKMFTISQLQVSNNTATLEIVTKKDNSTPVSRFFPIGLITSTMEFCGTAWVKSGEMARFAVYFRDSQTLSSYYGTWSDLTYPHTETYVADENLSSKGYVNGELLGMRPVVANTPGICTYIRFNGDTSQCYVKCIRLYSRALLPEEIQYNYLIDKERFGL